MVHPSGPYPPSLAHLMMYNQDHYPPGTPPPPHLASAIEVDAKTGIPRPRHSSELPLYHPLSPGSLGNVPHHLEVYNVPWQGQPFYPLTGALRSPYPTLINPSGMSRIGHPGLPPPHHGMAVTGIPHPAIVTSGTRQQDTQQQSNDRQPPPKEKESKHSDKRRPPHIKKPLNAFMLYMKEKRASVVKECTLKESAAINQILGRRWHALSREEQAKYYELARKERQLHMQLYPTWTARDNYAMHGKKKKKKKDKNPSDNSEPSTPKKCRARFGVDQQEFWCKPCRRKKKCIRYICSDENGQNKEDSCDSEDEQEFSQPTPPQRMPNNSLGSKEGSEGTRPPTSEPLVPSSSSQHHGEQANGSHSHRERALSSSSSLSEPRPPPPPHPHPYHHLTARRSPSPRPPPVPSSPHCTRRRRPWSPRRPLPQ
ncbi:transcription factor 7-like 2 [Acanthaster planci]|uniref:Transcription factor 7-like 2 n=1 Tax=Acanthaster planci TaxID=133434 RepID=A0A8B7Z383_ACAPL|nr:transcription factor 7-like 2 [Acanthaster planci]